MGLLLYNSYYRSFPHSLLSTNKFYGICNSSTTNQMIIFGSCIVKPVPSITSYICWSFNHIPIRSFRQKTCLTSFLKVKQGRTPSGYNSQRQDTSKGGILTIMYVDVNMITMLHHVYLVLWASIIQSYSLLPCEDQQLDHWEKRETWESCGSRLPSTPLYGCGHVYINVVYDICV